MNDLRLTISISVGLLFYLKEKEETMQEKVDLFEIRNTVRELSKIRFDKVSQKNLSKLFERFGLHVDFYEDGYIASVWS